MIRTLVFPERRSHSWFYLPPKNSLKILWTLEDIKLITNLLIHLFAKCAQNIFLNLNMHVVKILERPARQFPVKCYFIHSHWQCMQVWWPVSISFSWSLYQLYSLHLSALELQLFQLYYTLRGAQPKNFRQKHKKPLYCLGEDTFFWRVACLIKVDLTLSRESVFTKKL